MGSSKRQTVGFTYYFDIHMGLCRGPLDEILEIKVGDRTAWTGSVTESSTTAIDAGVLFGGISGEGGIEGELDVMMGEPDQEVNDRFLSQQARTPFFQGTQIFEGRITTPDNNYDFTPMHGTTVPAFRGVTTCLFSGTVCSFTPYPKPWSFRLRRTSSGWDGLPWYSEKAAIWLEGNTIKACNPAHIIYEAFTNRDWGRGLPRSLMGDSFSEGADILFNEGFGMCLRWNRQSTVKEFIDLVSGYIAGGVDLDPRTGKFELGLARQNYDVETLPHFTPGTGLLNLEEEEVSASSIAANEIIIVYRDPITNEDREVRCQNLAAIQAVGATVTEKLHYPGIPTHALAARVGQRELAMRCSGVKRFKLELDRRAYNLRPGNVIKVSEPIKGLSEIVVRIGEIDYGKLSAGTITADVVVDIFSLPDLSYLEPQPPQWTPPSIVAVAPSDYDIFETTYQQLAGTLSPLELDAVGDDAGVVSVLVARPSNLSTNYYLDTRVSPADYQERVTGDFCPTAEIVNAMPQGQQPLDVVIQNLKGANGITVGMEALIDDEIMRVDAWDSETSTVTLARGCVDTVPVAHAAEARVWFYDNGFTAIDTTEYVSGVTVDARIRTATTSSVLAAEDAPETNVLLNHRQFRPYAPGKLEANGDAYPEYITGELNLTWAYRNRLTQADQIIDTSVGNITPEVSTVAVLEILDENGSAIIETELEGVSFSLTDIAEFESGVTDAAPDRDLRIVGLGVVGGAAAEAVEEEFVSRVDGGWLAIDFYEGRFFDESDGSETSRNWSTAWSVATNSAGFTLNGSVYQSVISYDPAPGPAVAITKPEPDGQQVSILNTQDGFPRLIRDRRLDARRLIALSRKQFVLAYWVNNYTQTRVIHRDEFILHTVEKDAVVTGPLVSTRNVISGFNRCDLGQFNSPNGWYGSNLPGGSGRISPGYLGEVRRFSALSVAFGSLLYVVYLASDTTVSTVGRPFDITDVLDAHIDITTLLGDRTDVYSIDLDGAISLISTRSECVLADQVSATTGVEIIDASIRTVNSSTGAVGSLIATLPGGAFATRVAGDTVTETFYVLGDNGTIYHYDLSGTLLASLSIDDGENTGLMTVNSLLVTSGYVYFGFAGFVGGQIGKVLRVNKDLSSFSSFFLSSVTGGDDEVVDWVVGHPENDLLHAVKLLDESSESSALVLSDTPRLNDELTINLGSKRGATESLQSHSVTIKRGGYGLRYGEFYGG